MVVAELSRRAGSTWSAGKGLRADISQTRITSAGIGAVGTQADTVVLVRSRTFMNESGLAVGKSARYFQVPPDHVVVVHDELDLDFGRLRLKLGGGDNGHNGLKSIRASLGTGDFLRVRVGIGRPPGRQDPADFVLSGFPKAQGADLAEFIDRAADAVEGLLLDGLQAAQNRFNS
jgi:PTH1 family peptidyl-tRNA hydrolase